MPRNSSPVRVWGIFNSWDPNFSAFQNGCSHNLLFWTTLLFCVSLSHTLLLTLPRAQCPAPSLSRSSSSSIPSRPDPPRSVSSWPPDLPSGPTVAVCQTVRSLPLCLYWKNIKWWHQRRILISLINIIFFSAVTARDEYIEFLTTFQFDQHFCHHFVILLFTVLGSVFFFRSLQTNNFFFPHISKKICEFYKTKHA